MAHLEIGNARKVHSKPTVVAVDLVGGIESKHYEMIDRSLQILIGKGVRYFIFDLSSVRFVNEPDRLGERHRRFQAEGGGLALVAVTPKLRVIFGTLGLDQILPVRGTLDEGIAALTDGPVDRRKAADRRGEEAPRPPTDRTPAVEVAAVERQVAAVALRDPQPEPVWDSTGDTEPAEADERPAEERRRPFDRRVTESRDPERRSRPSLFQRLVGSLFRRG